MKNFSMKGTSIFGGNINFFFFLDLLRYKFFHFDFTNLTLNLPSFFLSWIITAAITSWQALIFICIHLELQHQLQIVYNFFCDFIVSYKDSNVFQMVTPAPYSSRVFFSDNETSKLGELIEKLSKQLRNRNKLVAPEKVWKLYQLL